jgi:hypothetical protein
MPRHDPVPPRPAALDSDSERAADAWARYLRLMKWMALAALAAAGAALLYLKMSGAPMRPSLVIATIAGVGLSVLLGTALMGLVFLSSAGGHDEQAAGRSDPSD